MIGIITDSRCDIQAELFEKYGSIIPQVVIWRSSSCMTGPVLIPNT